MVKVKIIAHSKSSITGKEIITWELEYPRMIHSEIMTHRLFSRNAASSRAIPVSKMIDMVRNSPACPVHWGQNQPGMQASLELSGNALDITKEHWRQAAVDAANHAEVMASAGAHKQVVNRILEPFQVMKTVMTATEDDNWFWLRDHNDADPTIHALASVMWEAKQTSEPVILEPGEWHLPYVTARRQHWRVEGDFGPMMYWDFRSGTELTLEQAKAVSASCCAQVSYRKLDDSLEKAKDIFAKLIESKPCHASPTEHQAAPMGYTRLKQPLGIKDWEEGVTHMDKNGDFWSGNFKGWVQHRQLIPDNVCNNYVPSTKETTND
jgi:hypothetical protein